MIEHPAFTASQNTEADRLETEARQQWAMGATEAARQRRERHMEQLRIARVSLWGGWKDQDNG